GVEDIAKTAPLVEDVTKAAATVKPAETMATPEAQAALRGTCRGARTVRGKQEVGYSVERAKRAAAANVHLSNQALPPEERLRLRRNEPKGGLPHRPLQRRTAG